MPKVDASEDAATRRVADSGAAPEEQQLRGRLRARLFGDAIEPVRIGRFIIIERIGRGGLGVVYSAYDPDLERCVAVKLIAPTFRNDDQAAAMHARLHREARAMAKLSHPNVVTIFDVGEHDGALFVAMELVEGASLRTWWKDAGDDWRRKRDLFVGAAKGLAAAHEKGIVHRDFKPSNVLVAGETAQVLDFGLARVSDSEAASVQPTPNPTGGTERGLSMITDAGTLIGTPAFMAPEQMTATTVDPRSDQFSFCVTVWEALYGHRPYGGDDIAERMAAIQRGPPPAPVRRDGPPVWLADALRKGMALEPDGRHASMEALIEALTVDLRSKRRQRTALLAAAVSSAVLAGGLGYAFRPRPPPDPLDDVERLALLAHEAAAKSFYVYPPSEAPDEPTAYTLVLSLENLGGEVDGLGDEKAANLRDEFSETLVRLGDTYWDRDGGRPFAIDYYAAALMFDPRQAQARGRAALTLGELAHLRNKATTRDFTRAELDAAETLHALAAPTRKARADRIAKRSNLAASSAARLARIADVPATEVRAKAVPEKRPPAASAPAAVADVADARVAAPLQPSQRSASADAPGSRKKDAATAVTAGRVAFGRGEYAKASNHFHRALELDARSHTAQAGLGELAFDRAKYSQAVREFRRAVKLAPKRAGYWLWLGDANLRVVQYDAARSAYLKAKQHGDSRAQSRLDKLNQRTGRGP